MSLPRSSAERKLEGKHWDQVVDHIDHPEVGHTHDGVDSRSLPGYARINHNHNGVHALLDEAGRMINGVDTTDDVIVDSATRGLVLKGTDGHYWRITVGPLGLLTQTDLGTTKP